MSSTLSLKSIVSDYPSWDQEKAINAAQQTTEQLGGRDNTGNLIASPESIMKEIDFQAIAGHNTDQLANIEGLFSKKVAQYLDETENIILLNDLANVNKFANLTVDKETQRLANLRMKSSSDLVKMRSKFLAKQYDINYNKFLTNIIITTLVFVIVACIAFYTFEKQKIDSYVFWWIIGVVISLYVIVIILLIKNKQTRRKDDWNKYYFFKSTDK
jgi:hypothetical protein